MKAHNKQCKPVQLIMVLRNSNKQGLNIVRLQKSSKANSINLRNQSFKLFLFLNYEVDLKHYIKCIKSTKKHKMFVFLVFFVLVKQVHLINTPTKRDNKLRTRHKVEHLKYIFISVLNDTFQNTTK